MDNKEIMVKNEVIEATEKIASADSGNSFKMAVGIGLAVFGGVVAFKYIIKPIVTEIKKKKEDNGAESCSAEPEDFNEID